MSEKDPKNTQKEQGFESVEHALTRSEQFIEQYKKEISIGLVAVVVIIMAVFGYNSYIVAPKEKKAAEQIFQGERYFAADSFKLALNGDGSYLGFIYIEDKYSSTKIGNLAAYYAGISYLNLGDFNNALKYLKKFDGKDKMLAPIAEGAKGDCYLELGDYKKAAGQYSDAVSMGNDFTSPVYLKKMGAAYELLGNFDKAEKAYSRIKDEFGSSIEARDIDKYIARAKAQIK